MPLILMKPRHFQQGQPPEVSTFQPPGFRPAFVNPEDPNQYRLLEGRFFSSIGRPPTFSQANPVHATLPVPKSQIESSSGGLGAVIQSRPDQVLQPVRTAEPQFISVPPPPDYPFAGHLILMEALATSVGKTPRAVPACIVKSEPAPPFQGLVTEAIGHVQSVDTTASVTKKVLTSPESQMPYQGGVLSEIGQAPSASTVSLATRSVFTQPVNTPPSEGVFFRLVGGTDSASLTPRPAPAVIARQEEKIPPTGASSSSHGIAVWWPKPQAVNVVKTEERQPHIGQLIRGLAIQSVTPQEKPPSPYFAVSESPRPFSGYALIGGVWWIQQIIIIPIIPTPRANLFRVKMVPARPNRATVVRCQR